MSGKLFSRGAPDVSEFRVGRWFKNTFTKLGRIKQISLIGVDIALVQSLVDKIIKLEKGITVSKSENTNHVVSDDLDFNNIDHLVTLAQRFKRAGFSGAEGCARFKRCLESTRFSVTKLDSVWLATEAKFDSENPKPVNNWPETSTGLLAAARDIQEQRAKDYDQAGGERSMAKTVAAFNAITGRDLTESEGWLLMVQLKLVRDRSTANPHPDSILDNVSYSALHGEARLKERGVSLVESLCVIAMTAVLCAIVALSVSNGNSPLSFGVNGITETRCINNMQFVIGAGGQARQILNEKGQGVACP